MCVCLAAALGDRAIYTGNPPLTYAPTAPPADDPMFQRKTREQNLKSLQKQLKTDRESGLAEAKVTRHKHGCQECREVMSVSDSDSGACQSPRCLWHTWDPHGGALLTGWIGHTRATTPDEDAVENIAFDMPQGDYGEDTDGNIALYRPQCDFG